MRVEMKPAHEHKATARDARSLAARDLKALARVARSLARQLEAEAHERKAWFARAKAVVGIDSTTKTEEEHRSALMQALARPGFARSAWHYMSYLRLTGNGAHTQNAATVGRRQAFVELVAEGLVQHDGTHCWLAERAADVPYQHCPPPPNAHGGQQGQAPPPAAS